MALCPHLTFQVLTKRAERMRDYCEARFGKIADAIMRLRKSRGDLGVVCPLPSLPPGAIWWPLSNVWLGVSVESDENHQRIWDLLRTPVSTRFISYEPALGPLDLDKWEALCRTWRKGATIGTYLDWVIVGGESGPGARPFHLEWARDVIRQCRAAGVACFVKQLGANPIEDGGPLRLCDQKGGDMREWLEDLRVREFPGGTAV
jgi:protein gp37